MTLFRIWVSRDGYYISEAQAVEMTGRQKPWIVRPQPPPRLLVYATEEDLAAPVPYSERRFECRQIACPDGTLAETLKIAIAAGASLDLGGEKLQPYRYGEMDEYDWERVELFGDAP